METIKSIAVGAFAKVAMQDLVLTCREMALSSLEY